MPPRSSHPVSGSRSRTSGVVDIGDEVVVVDQDDDVGAAADSIDRIQKAIDGQLDQLRIYCDTATARWTGPARDAYHVLQSDWDATRCRRRMVIEDNAVYRAWMSFSDRPRIRSDWRRQRVASHLDHAEDLAAGRDPAR